MDTSWINAFVEGKYYSSKTSDLSDDVDIFFGKPLWREIESLFLSWKSFLSLLMLEVMDVFSFLILYLKFGRLCFILWSSIPVPIVSILFTSSSCCRNFFHLLKYLSGRYWAVFLFLHLLLLNRSMDSYLLVWENESAIRSMN